MAPTICEQRCWNSQLAHGNGLLTGLQAMPLFQLCFDDFHFGIPKRVEIDGHHTRDGQGSGKDAEHQPNARYRKITLCLVGDETEE